MHAVCRWEAIKRNFCIRALAPAGPSSSGGSSRGGSSSSTGFGGDEDEDEMLAASGNKHKWVAASDAQPYITQCSCA